jgi:hypothetical protein
VTPSICGPVNLANIATSLHLPVDDGEHQLQGLCDLRPSALMHFRDHASAARRAVDESGIVPHAIVRLLCPEDRLAIRQGIAHPRADRVRVFTRERENVAREGPRRRRNTKANAPALAQSGIFR